jgi:hypothetical protein
MRLITTDKEAAEALLGFFGQLALSPLTDRSKTGIAHLDPLTGQPLTSNDQVSIAEGVGGMELAMQTWIVPKRFAAGFVRRAAEGSKHGIALATLADSLWTAGERAEVYETIQLVKRAVHRLHESGGYFDPRPPDLMDGTPLPLDPVDGMTDGFKITWKGLKLAVEFAQAHPEIKWESLSPENDFGAEAWRLAPEHVRQRWKNPEERINVRS